MQRHSYLDRRLPWGGRMTTFKTEAEFQDHVERMCAERGLLIHHCTDARKCHGRGWPDPIIVSACGNGIIYAELKLWGDRSPDQTAWGWSLLANGADYKLWNPSQMDEITEALDKLADCAARHE